MAVPPSKARNFRFARRRLGHARRSLRRKTTENEDIMSVVNTPRETQETPSHARISFTRGTKAHHPRYSYNSLAYITPVFHALPLSYSLTRSFFLSFPLSPAVSSIFFSLSLSLSLSLVRSLFLSLSLSPCSFYSPSSIASGTFFLSRASFFLIRLLHAEHPSEEDNGDNDDYDDDSDGHVPSLSFFFSSFVRSFPSFLPLVFVPPSNFPAFSSQNLVLLMCTPLVHASSFLMYRRRARLHGC